MVISNFCQNWSICNLRYDFHITFFAKSKWQWYPYLRKNLNSNIIKNYYGIFDWKGQTKIDMTDLSLSEKIFTKFLNDYGILNGQFRFLLSASFEFLRNTLVGRFVSKKWNKETSMRLSLHLCLSDRFWVCVTLMIFL